MCDVYMYPPGSAAVTLSTAELEMNSFEVYTYLNNRHYCTAVCTSKAETVKRCSEELIKVSDRG